MRRDLIDELRCPYCNGSFTLIGPPDEGSVEYGLLECRCFQFPIVGGILLLSLAKGYGIAEDRVLPYAPLQVAAVTHLQKGDVAGLRAWIDEHVPMVGRLLSPEVDSYLAGAAALHEASVASSQRFLADEAKYGVVGVPAVSGWRRRLRGGAGGLGDPARASEAELVDQRRDFYVSRFISPRVNSLALMIASLREPSSMLSLCCGHGILENILATVHPATEVISVDAQLLNLLLARRFVHPAGTFICHDLQFPLPFADATFDAVASSTCLPEVPPQASFVREAVRVARPDGWALFDSVWNVDLGARRIDPGRPYRYAQNFFAELVDYVPFFDECAGADREVGLDVAKPPASYVGGSTWTFGADRSAELAAGTDPEISFLVVGRGERPMVDQTTAWVGSERIAISPAFRSHRDGTSVDLERLPQFEELHRDFAPAGFAGYRPMARLDLGDLDLAARLERFSAGELVILPERFSSEHSSLGSPAIGATGSQDAPQTGVAGEPHEGP